MRGYVCNSWKHLGHRVVALILGLGLMRVTVENSAETSKLLGFQMCVCLCMCGAYVCLWMSACVCVHIWDMVMVVMMIGGDDRW